MPHNEKKPWEFEPHVLMWTHSRTGLDCYINRNRRTGALNGYVAVAEGHPLFGCRDWQKMEDAGVSVHGGITYSQSDAPFRHDSTVSLWWIGFDCNHGGTDLAPEWDSCEMLRNLPRMSEQTYKTFVFVIAECEQLAGQLWKINYAPQPLL